jgi:hypothetical protein
MSTKTLQRIVEEESLENSSVACSKESTSIEHSEEKDAHLAANTEQEDANDSVPEPATAKLSSTIS